jgi:cytochrome c-type biogenesis protein CcmH/NrfG
MSGTAESWPDDEVWRRLEGSLASFQDVEMPGMALDDEAALDKRAAAARDRIAAAPGDHTAYRTLAVVSALRGATTEAIEAMRTALQLDPEATPPTA